MTKPPAWPTEPGKPPMQLHLEVRVTEPTGALEFALAAGAALADHQPQLNVCVCLGPAGHTFCLSLADHQPQDHVLVCLGLAGHPVLPLAGRPSAQGDVRVCVDPGPTRSVADA